MSCISNSHLFRSFACLCQGDPGISRLRDPSQLTKNTTSPDIRPIPETRFYDFARERSFLHCFLVTLCTLHHLFVPEFYRPRVFCHLACNEPIERSMNDRNSRTARNSYLLSFRYIYNIYAAIFNLFCFEQRLVY